MEFKEFKSFVQNSIEIIIADLDKLQKIADETYAIRPSQPKQQVIVMPAPVPGELFRILITLVLGDK